MLRPLRAQQGPFPVSSARMSSPAPSKNAEIGPEAAQAPAGVVDLRSDTVTRPTPGMRAAIAAAEVGDDIFREDPTVRRLEEQVAARIGTAAALFVPSGTMANQLGIRCHAVAGDDVLCSEGAHIQWYEAGAAASLAGVQLVAIGNGSHSGLFDPDHVTSGFHPVRGDYSTAPMRLLCIENTHNRGGGRVWPRAQLEAVCAAARGLGLKLHLDGARLWNAAIAQGVPPQALAAGFDTVAVCLSKGLGAPVGSLLCGSRETIETARRFRKMYGGAMRQVGILAAAGLYALEHHYTRLAEDHDHARLLAERIAETPHVTVVPPETNIVLFDLAPPAPDAGEIVRRLATRGVLSSAFGPRRVRLVTHLEVGRSDCERAAAAVREVVCG